MKIAIYLFVILAINSQVFAQDNPPKIVWDKHHTIDNFTDWVIQPYCRLIYHNEKLYILHHGLTNIPGFSIQTFPFLVSYDLNGNEMAKYQLLRDNPTPFLDNSTIIGDINFKEDTINVAMNARMPGNTSAATAIQILKFDKQHSKPFYRVPDVVNLGETGISSHSISLIGDSLGYFGGVSYPIYLIRPLDTATYSTVIYFSKIREYYPTIRNFRGKISESDKTMSLIYNVNDKVGNNINVLVKFDITQQNAEPIWIVEFSDSYRTGYYCENEQNYYLIKAGDISQGSSKYKLLTINSQGELINEIALEFSKSNSSYMICGLKKSKNGKFFYVYGWEKLGATGQYNRFDIYDINWELLESYTWQTLSLSQVLDIFELENGNIIIYGGQGDIIYLAEVQPNYTSISKEHHRSINFSVVPNPANDRITIDSDSYIDIIEVYSILGERIMTKTNTNSINISNLASGIYFIRIGTYFTSFFKQ